MLSQIDLPTELKANPVYKKKKKVSSGINFGSQPILQPNKHPCQDKPVRGPVSVAACTHVSINQKCPHRP